MNKLKFEKSKSKNKKYLVILHQVKKKLTLDNCLTNILRIQPH